VTHKLGVEPRSLGPKPNVLSAKPLLLMISMACVTTPNQRLQPLKRLCHGQKCLHLFSYSEAYHEQMGPIPSSNRSLDIALSNAHT